MYYDCLGKRSNWAENFQFNWSDGRLIDDLTDNSPVVFLRLLELDPEVDDLAIFYRMREHSIYNLNIDPKNYKRSQFYYLCNSIKMVRICVLKWIKNMRAIFKIKRESCSGAGWEDSSATWSKFNESLVVFSSKSNLHRALDRSGLIAVEWSQPISTYEWK